MLELQEREAATERLEDEIAQACGLVNAATGWLVELLAQVMDAQAWVGDGIRSAEQWVGWKTGTSSARAHGLVAMARRLGELPETAKAFATGELSEDQVRLICRYVPAVHDAEAAALGRHCTVGQLHRALSKYQFGPPASKPAQPPAEPADDKRDERADVAAADEPADEPAEEFRRVSFGYGDDGYWRLSARLSPEEGALWERALAERRQALYAERQADDARADQIT